MVKNGAAHGDIRVRDQSLDQVALALLVCLGALGVLPHFSENLGRHGDLAFATHAVELATLNELVLVGVQVVDRAEEFVEVAFVELADRIALVVAALDLKAGTQTSKRAFFILLGGGAGDDFVEVLAGHLDGVVLRPHDLVDAGCADLGALPIGDHLCLSGAGADGVQVVEQVARLLDDGRIISGSHSISQLVLNVVHLHETTVEVDALGFAGLGVAVKTVAQPLGVAE